MFSCKVSQNIVKLVLDMTYESTVTFIVGFKKPLFFIDFLLLEVIELI